MPATPSSPLYAALQAEYPSRIRCDESSACHLRVDEAFDDVPHCACAVHVELTAASATTFCLQLINVPWNQDLECLVHELEGALDGPDTCKTLTFSGAAKDYRCIKQLAKAVRAVTGRGRRYLDSNWKWSSRKTAEALERLASCLLTAHRQSKTRGSTTVR